jgi:hypothetical protein
MTKLMKRTTCVSAITALTFALGVGMKAQSASSSPTSQSSRENVTVTGCLQGDPASVAASATAPGAAAATASSKFVLANAKIGAVASGASAAGTSGSTTASAGSGSSYALEGDATELQKHVGHEIEVTGRIESPSASAPSGTGTTGSAPPAPAIGSSPASKAGSMQKVQVQSVKMISVSCGAK